MRTLAVGCGILLAGAALTNAGVEPQLRVNFNPISAPLTDILLGEQDPTYIQVIGPAGATYALAAETVSTNRRIAHRAALSAPITPTVVGGVDFSNTTPAPTPSLRVTGTLDALGHAEIMLPAGTFRRGAKVGIRAIVTEGSGVTASTPLADALVVRTMSANIQVTPAPGSLAKVRGPVLAKGAAQLAVGNIIFNMGPETEFSNVDSFAEIQVGDWVEIGGGFNANGPFPASDVGVEDAEPEVRLSGRVQGVGPAGLVLLNVSVYVNSETVYTDLNTGMPASYLDITPGMPIHIFVGANEMFPSASEVQLNAPIDPEPEPEPEPEDENENEDPPPPPRPFCS